VSYSKALWLICAWFFTLNAWSDLQAVGLMNGMAIVEYNGQRLVLREGVEQSGIELLSADSQEAVVLINGRKEVLKLGISVASGYKGPSQEVVRLSRAQNGHYFTEIKINGKTVPSLVDTGATNLAISGTLAKKIGLNFANGKKSRSSTAAGIVRSYVIRANKVQLGGITKYNVPVNVLEGDFPEIPLLGMSFLNQLQMREENGMLILTD